MVSYLHLTSEGMVGTDQKILLLYELSVAEIYPSCHDV